MIKSIKDISHVLYINLEERSDRKKHIEEQLTKIGICKDRILRFNAIRLNDGRMGCSMSHLKCIQMAKENSWKHVLICEDDMEFLNPTLFIQQSNSFFEKQSEWDILLLAGNNIPPYKREREDCVQVYHCQTTTGYLVKEHYYDKLIQNIKEGMAKLIREPTNHFLYAIDKYWFALQEKDKWFIITPLTVVQREDYSNIEKRMTNFVHAMTDLDKIHLFRNTFRNTFEKTV